MIEKTIALKIVIVLQFVMATLFFFTILWISYAYNKLIRRYNKLDTSLNRSCANVKSHGKAEEIKDHDK